MVESLHTTQLQSLHDRIRAGDLAARDELLRAVCGRLERLARQMVQDFPKVQRWADTGDVLQGALMRLMRALEEVEFQSMRDFFGLAATQIRRELLDLARRFNGPMNDAAHHDSAAAADLDPAEHSSGTMSLSEWTLFHEAVDKLPTNEREVVSLIYYHEWTQAQVAELFQVNLKTVRRWWQSALIKLSQAIKRDLQDSV